MAVGEFLEEAEGDGDDLRRLIQRTKKIEGNQAVCRMKIGGGDRVADVGRPEKALEDAEVGRLVFVADSQADLATEELGDLRRVSGQLAGARASPSRLSSSGTIFSSVKTSYVSRVSTLSGEIVTRT